MTPLPKRKLSRRRQGKRRAAIKLVLENNYACPNCGAAKLNHRVCPNCGQYKGRQVVVKKARKKKSENQT